MYFQVYQEQPKNALAAPATIFGGGGEWRWRLRGDNNETVSSGESYKNEADCLHAIELIMDTNRQTPVRRI